MVVGRRLRRHMVDRTMPMRMPNFNRDRRVALITAASAGSAGQCRKCGCADWLPDRKLGRMRCRNCGNEGAMLPAIKSDVVRKAPAEDGR